MNRSRGSLALSVGCPCGVGPEVSVLAAAESKARVILVGDFRVIARAAVGRGVDPSRLRQVASPEDKTRRGEIAVWQPTKTLAVRDTRFGKPTIVSGAAQLAWIDAACDLTRSGIAAAMVTGPVSKEAISGSGAPGSAGFLGHTEHLQARLRAREVVMAFWTPKLTTALVTTHLSLAAVPRAITATAVARATYFLGALLADLSRGPVRKIVVCGLNPHAGENGLLGSEETTRILPGISRAKTRLAAARKRVIVDGPRPAESAFRHAANGRFDGVVAMYHDQATIPMKLVGFGEAVNVSLGLPIVRTSVDHGTAYDIAGTWVADPRGMSEAIALAARLSRV
jgi:4-hydroxythreonine-4-phosphate dehydrogenase